MSAGDKALNSGERSSQATGNVVPAAATPLGDGEGARE